jgi:zinc transport system substrate-binding protein
MYEFTSQIAGSLARVELLVEAGIEPHDWQPSAQQVKQLEQADMLVYNGAGMEGWVDQVIGALDNKKLVAVEASKGVTLRTGEAHDHEASHAEEHHHEEEKKTVPSEKVVYDPHVWLSPKKAMEQVRIIQRALVRMDPTHESTYNANADAYVATLTALDAQYRAQLAPFAKREFITQHAAFGYLAHEYGLQQLPIAGLSPEIEPSATRMAEIVTFVKEHGVRTIFFETLASSKVAEAIAQETGAKTATLNPIEGLTEAEKQAGDQYVRLMERNLDALVASFQP